MFEIILMNLGIAASAAVIGFILGRKYQRRQHEKEAIRFVRTPFAERPNLVKTSGAADEVDRPSATLSQARFDARRKRPER